METDLIGVCNDHSLIPKCRHRAVNDIVIGRWSDPGVIKSAFTAVVNQAPIIFRAEIATNECKSVETCERPPVDGDLNNSTAGARPRCR
jgi:hypothetical protein